MGTCNVVHSKMLAHGQPSVEIIAQVQKHESETTPSTWEEVTQFATVCTCFMRAYSSSKITALLGV